MEHEPTAGYSGSLKRKRPDEDETLEEDCDDDDDDYDDEERHARGLAGGLRPLTRISDNDDDVDEYETNDEDSEDEKIRGDFFKLDKVLRYQEGKSTTKNGDIKVTPFNLEEELEEGKFDDMGNYTFKKDSDDDDENKDAWADTINWDDVQNRQKQGEKSNEVVQSQRPSSSKTSNRSENVSDSNVDHSKPPLDQLGCYKEMLRIMKPDETVQRAIRRLGNDVPKRRPNKTKANSASNLENPEMIAEIKRKLDRMIELAHQRLEEGDTDIYQKSYEDLEEAIN